MYYGRIAVLGKDDTVVMSRQIGLLIEENVAVFGLW